MEVSEVIKNRLTSAISRDKKSARVALTGGESGFLSRNWCRNKNDRIHKRHSGYSGQSLQHQLSFWMVKPLSQKRGKLESELHVKTKNLQRQDMTSCTCCSNIFSAPQAFLDPVSRRIEIYHTHDVAINLHIKCNRCDTKQTHMYEVLCNFRQIVLSSRQKLQPYHCGHYEAYLAAANRKHMASLPVPRCSCWPHNEVHTKLRPKHPSEVRHCGEINSVPPKLMLIKGEKCETRMCRRISMSRYHTREPESVKNWFESCFQSPSFTHRNNSGDVCFLPVLLIQSLVRLGA